MKQKMKEEWHQKIWNDGDESIEFFERDEYWANLDDYVYLDILKN